MKYLKYFLIVSVAFVGLSSNTTRTSRLSEGIYPGNLFPDIKNLENVSGASIDLSDLRGKKVLVNFWAAYDATSHRDNVLFSNLIEEKNYHVQMVSVSLDESESVFSKTIAMDKVDGMFQFRAQGNLAKDLLNRYQLQRGFKNYLIDENGVVLGMNLTSENLDQLLKEN